MSDLFLIVSSLVSIAFKEVVLRLLLDFLEFILNRVDKIFVLLIHLLHVFLHLLDIVKGELHFNVLNPLLRSQILIGLNIGSDSLNINLKIYP